MELLFPEKIAPPNPAGAVRFYAELNCFRFNRRLHNFKLSSSWLNQRRVNFLVELHLLSKFILHKSPEKILLVRACLDIFVMNAFCSWSFKESFSSHLYPCLRHLMTPPFVSWNLTVEFSFKIGHCGSADRTVLEQNKFSKKVTSNRDWTGTLGLW